ncbi:hypothetical protein AB0M48_05530 [Lentzea sp. NPDC051208]|uniref:hypothetical protein n=1 Tax=Lentzea sp. NPDC051208 TaxID=3154642 RepID=UPI003424BBA2
MAALLMVVMIPVIAVGLAVLLAQAKTAVEHGVLRFLAVLGLFLLVWLVVFLSSAVHGIGVGIAAFFSLAIAVVSAGTATTMTYLAEHGRTVPCRVLDVDRRVEVNRYLNGDGTYSTESSTYYDHRLECGDGGPSTVTKPEALAGIGDHIELTFDPDDRVAPELAGDVAERDVKKGMAVVFLVLTILIRVVHVLVLQAQERAERDRARRRATPVKPVSTVVASAVRKPPVPPRPPQNVAPKKDRPAGLDPNLVLRAQSKYHR